MKRRNLQELDAGWALDKYGREKRLYHFEHVTMSKAEAASSRSESALYAIDAINWTCANGDCRSVHRNCYFAEGVKAAVMLAANLVLESAEVAEDAIGIRLATRREQAQYRRAKRQLAGKRTSRAIPDLA